MENVRPTGIYATEQEREEIRRLVQQAHATPAIVLRHSNPADPSALPRDEASYAWERVQKECHRQALAHGLPEIEGYYGMGLDGEYLVVED